MGDRKARPEVPREVRGMQGILALLTAGSRRPLWFAVKGETLWWRHLRLTPTAPAPSLSHLSMLRAYVIES